MLDPRDKGVRLTSSQKVAATRALEELLSHPELNRNECLREWANWKANSGVFNDPQRSFAWDDNIDIHTFWAGVFDDTSLSRIVAMIKPMVSTSASNERYWSVHGYNHSKSRNRYVFYLYCLYYYF